MNENTSDKFTFSVEDKEYVISKKSDPEKNNDKKTSIHTPSIVIGAGITAVCVLVIFFGFGGIAEQDHQLIEKEILEKSSMPEPTKISEDVFLKNNSPILGNPNAPITLIEFGDFQCHYCNVYFQNIEPMIIENFVETGKVNVIFKDYTIIGPDSFDAAYGAHCASEQNKYWEYHNILFKNWAGENNGWAGKQNLVKFADDINLDLELFSECMNSTRYSDMINQSGVDAQTLGITGTPAFFILDRENGQVLTIIGAQPYEVFEKVFNSMLEI